MPIRRPTAVVTVEFNRARMRMAEEINCFNREDEAVLYEHQPSVEFAQWLCDSCPMFDLCDEYARTTKPGWGIWGGRSWAYGSPKNK